MTAGVDYTLNAGTTINDGITIINAGNYEIYYAVKNTSTSVTMLRFHLNGVLSDPFAPVNQGTGGTSSRSASNTIAISLSANDKIQF